MTRPSPAVRVYIILRSFETVLYAWKLVTAVTNGIAPQAASDTFKRIEIHSHDLCDTSNLSLHKFSTIKYGKLSLRYEADNIWDKLPPPVVLNVYTSSRVFEKKY